MKRIVFVFIFLLTVYNLQFTAAFAQPISSVELISRAKDYDGKAVAYQGEAIGEVMLRGNYAWVNLNDGANAIGIWVDKSLTRAIQYMGSYKAQGDTIEAIGIFHRACPEHGGDLDIHAQSIRNVSPGRMLPERFNTGKRNFSLVLAGVLCLVLILRLFKSKSLQK